MKKPSHILLIRLSAMGDVAMTVPVIQVLLQTYPEIKITVLSRRFFKPLFQDISGVSFYEADVYGKHKGILGLHRLSKELHLLGIDAIADLHNVIRSKFLTALLGLRGVPSEKLDKGRKEKAQLIRANGGVMHPLKSMHERYAEVFSKLGYPIDLSKWVKPTKPILPGALKNEMLSDTRIKIGFAPFAAFASKSYPLEKAKELVRLLDQEGRYLLYLFGGGTEEEKFLNDMADSSENVFNMAGKGSFRDELNCMAHLDIMVSMDSGNGHLAAMFGIPVITVWGVTHPYAGFVPFGQPMENQLIADRDKYPLIPTSIYGNKFPEGYENAIGSIAPETVLNKIREVLT